MSKETKGRLHYPISMRGVGISCKKDQNGKIQYELYFRAFGGTISTFYGDLEPAIIEAIENAWQLGYRHAFEIMEKEVGRKLSKSRIRP